MIDGERGVLTYEGYDVRDLVEHSSDEEVCFLLLHGRLPTAGELDAWAARVRRARINHAEETEEVVRLLAARRVTPMEMLRTAVSWDSFDDPLKKSNSPAADVAKAVGLIGRMPVMVARFCRLRAGLSPVAPNPELSRAGNFLWMLHGQMPSPEAERTLDRALILHAEHGLDASTYVARVIASTRADLHSAVTGAIGALKGPLHGGANEEVMALLEEIGEEWMVDEIVRTRLAFGKRMMGFGSRVYRGPDPRTAVLKDLARDLAEHHDPRWFRLCEGVERVVMAERGLHPNVHFYAAPVYRYLGIPADVFPAIFAMSHVTGWAAHIIDQHKIDRLIRPDDPGSGHEARPYVPVAERGLAVAVASGRPTAADRLTSGR